MVGKWTIKAISSGSGLHWMPRLGKLLVYILEIVAQYQKSALWNSMPPVYRQCAVIYTDHWSAYDSVLPSKRHYSVDKDSGCTSYIERFNCTIRQRVSRLVRKSLSFSKKLENHIAAIWSFVHHYNASLQLYIPTFFLIRFCFIILILSFRALPILLRNLSYLG